MIVDSPENCAPWGVELTRLCQLEGFNPRFEPRYRTHDFHAVQALAAAGQGLSLLPELSLSCIPDDVVIRRLKPAPVRHVKLGFPPTFYRSAACEALVGIVRETVDEWTTAHGGALDAQAENRTSAA